MARKIGWGDESISGGYGDDSLKDRRYKGIKGQKHIIRVMTDCDLYRVHVINDVAEAREDGEERVFYLNCSRTWDDNEEDWAGECLGCERDYDTNDKYIAGVIVLGIQKGRGKIQTIDPETTVHYWTFGPDKYRKLSNIYLELQRAKKKKVLKQVELTVTCEDEQYQKLDVHVSQADNMTTKGHVAAWNEEGPELIAEASKSDSPSVQKRKLKKRRSRSAASDDSGPQDEEAPTKKKRRAKKKPADPEPPESNDEDEGSTGDDDLDDLLAEIE